MKCLILSENSNGVWPHLHFRSMGPFELRKRLESKGHEATIIDWFTKWSEEKLKTVITKYKPDILATSAPFNSQDLHYLKNLMRWVKETYPDIKIIHGGTRQYDDAFKDLVDVFFLGRSMEIFDAWIDNQDISKYTVNENPLVLVNNQFNQYIDNPVIPIIKEEDFITDKDILGFELGVGCKFNCSFCNYELRNAKVSNLADPKELHEYFKEVNAKYGVTHFFASDDTINETDSKLEILVEAMSGLSYHPLISTYARLDLITGRSTQIKLFEKIQFKSLFFGIESFNPEASKLIRKKSGLGDNYATLKQLKELCPNTYTVGGLIIGLNGDSEESIRSSLNRVIEEKLLNSVQMYPLSITVPQGHYDSYFASDIDKNPESFDYKITQISHGYHGNQLMPEYRWISDWSTSLLSTRLSQNLYTEISTKLEDMGHLEYAGVHALGLYKPLSTEDERKQLKSKCFSYSDALKANYIRNKLQSFN